MKNLVFIIVLLFLLPAGTFFIFTTSPGAEADPVLSAEEQFRFRGDLANTGVALCENAPGTNRTVWKFETGEDIYSSAVVANERVYIGSWDKYLYCLDALTGRELWKFNTQDKIYSSPTYWNGHVYIGTGTEGGAKIARYYAVNATTGEEDWSFKASKNFVGGASIVDGVLYTGSLDGNLYALDAHGNPDGTTKVHWRFTTAGEIWSTPAIYNNSIYITSSDCWVYRVSMTGQELWRYQTEFSLDGMWGSPAVADGLVFFGSAYTPLGKFYALDADSGEHVWNFSTGKSRYGVVASPAYFHGVVYVGANNGRMYAINTTRGEELWNFSTGDDYNGIYSSTTYADGKLYFGSSDNKLYCLNASTGAELWSFRSGGFGEYGCCASATIVSGLLYIGFTGDGTLYCFGDRVIPEIELDLELYNPNFASGGPQFITAGDTTSLKITATNAGTGIFEAELVISADNGLLSSVSGTTDEGGVWFTDYTAPLVSKATQVEVAVKAEAPGYLTNESIFYIDVQLNPALTYSADNLVSSVLSEGSVLFVLTVEDMRGPAGNASVEFRVSDGKISPVSMTTNETGEIIVKFTAPELVENETGKTVEIIIRLHKTGYEDGRYVEELSVLPPEPVEDGKEDKPDVVIIGLVIIIIVLVIAIISVSKLKGKRYW